MLEESGKVFAIRLENNFKKISSYHSGSSQEISALYKRKWSNFRCKLFEKYTVILSKTDGHVSDIDKTKDIDNEEEVEILISEQN